MPHASHLELWKEYEHTRSIEARNALAMAYQPMVRGVAVKLKNAIPGGCGLEFEDLLGVGQAGLLQAIEKFDRKRGWTFETFAPFRIRGAVLDAIRDLDWVPRLERQRAKTDRQVAENIRTIVLQSDHERAVRRGDADGSYRLDPIDHRAPCACTRLRSNEWLRNRGLDDREKLLLFLYYGEEKTMKEIGRSTGLSESRVSQMHSAVIARLRTLETAKEAAPARLPRTRQVRAAERSKRVVRKRRRPTLSQSVPRRRRITERASRSTTARPSPSTRREASSPSHDHLRRAQGGDRQRPEAARPGGARGGRPGRRRRRPAQRDVRTRRGKRHRGQRASRRLRAEQEPQPERIAPPQSRLRQWAQQLERLCDHELPKRSSLGGQLLWMADQQRRLADEIELGAVVLYPDQDRRPAC